MVIFHNTVQTAIPPSSNTHTQSLLTGPAEVPDVISTDKAAEEHKRALSLRYEKGVRGRGRDKVWARGDAKEAAMNWDGSLKRKVAKAQDEKSYHGKINRKKS